MTAVNKNTKEVVSWPGIEEWVAHYSVGDNTTYVLLGDDILALIVGDASIEECESVLRDEWHILQDKDLKFQGE